MWDLSNTCTAAAAAPRPFAVLKGHTGSVNDVCFSGNSVLIATASADKTVKVWDAVKGEELRTLMGHTEKVYGVAFHPKNSGVLVSCSYDCTARVWKH